MNYTNCTLFFSIKLTCTYSNTCKYNRNYTSLERRHESLYLEYLLTNYMGKKYKLRII